MTVQGATTAADSIRAAIESVVSGAEYQTRSLADPFAPLRRAWNALLDWLDRLRETNPEAYRGLVWLLIGVLLLIVGHAAWVALRTFRTGTAASDEADTATVAVPRDAAWYAATAARLAAQGRFAEAMQADFVRLVLELDGRRGMRFHPSKTPGEYSREASFSPGQREEFRALIRTLYRHAFAGQSAGPEQWSDWQSLAHARRYATPY